jgi:excisionase family DNA binding protein
MTGLVSIKKAAELLGCGISTLRRWDREGKFTAVRTPGGKRRYRLEDIERFQGVVQKTSPKVEAVAVYCRVSSNEQKTKGDLERQKGRVLQHCVERGYAVTHVFEEVGSSMNDNRPKLHKLFDLAVAGEITRVVVEHKDRFIRFNAAILTRFLNSHGVHVEWMQDVLPKSYEAEIVEDMMSLIASFSAKVYGCRSADRRKKAAA